jgi:hypothetical protein
MRLLRLRSCAGCGRWDVTIDHLRYIQDQSYRREIHARVRRFMAEGRGLSAAAVVHEAGNACCQREAWPVTHARIVASVSADGDRMLGVTL